jgi:hypothetical protein
MARAKKPAPAKQPKPKAKPKAKAKQTTTKAKPRTAAARSAVEVEAAKLLASYEAGDIDNAWDVMPQLMELDKTLPRSSPLWKAFNRMSVELGEICRKSAMGED